MKYQEITNKEEWDKKIGSQKMSQFLQSWEWSLFNKNLKSQILNLKIDEDYLFVITKPLFLGFNYLYIPRTKVNLRPTIYNALQELAKKEKAVFIRYDSGDQKTETLDSLFKMYHGHRVKDVQPTKTWLLDLTKTEEQLLAEMHPKTRYNIRLAEKKGVICREGKIEEFEQFWRLIKETYKRQGITTHTKDYYLKMLQTCDFVKLYFAEYDGKIIVANLVAFFGDTVTYVHGGSDNEYKNLMAPQLLQWYQIKLAKSLGFKYYDFHGIDENKWPGITRFKKGFGGFDYEYAGCWDLVLNKPVYYCYEILRKINLAIRKIIK